MHLIKDDYTSDSPFVDFNVENVHWSMVSSMWWKVNMAKEAVKDTDESEYVIGQIPREVAGADE